MTISGLYGTVAFCLVATAGLFHFWRWLSSRGPFAAEVYVSFLAVWSLFVPPMVSILSSLPNARGGDVPAFLVGGFIVLAALGPPALITLRRVVMWRFNRAAMVAPARLEDA